MNRIWKCQSQQWYLLSGKDIGSRESLGDMPEAKKLER